ncbi:MAG: Flp pilus assembly protein TadD [Parasphingorhabdus sp.]|jgi:Flp pilus assembly protein TadD
MSNRKIASTKITRLRSRAVELLQQKAYAEAAPVMELLLKLAPELKKERKNLAIVLTNLGQHEAAIPHLQKLLTVKPIDFEIQKTLAITLERAGRQAEATQLWMSYIKSQPNDLPIVRHVADQLKNQGHLDNAAQLLQQSLILSPANASLATDCGALWLQAGQPAKAIECLEVALEADNSHGDLNNNYAIALDQNGETFRARQLLVSNIKQHPSHAGIHGTLARLYERTSAPQSAERHFREALKLSADSFALKNDLALFLNNEGRSDEAIEIFNQLIKSDATNAGLLNNLGHLYSTRGEFPKAENYYRQALQIRANYGEAWRNLGLIRKYTAKDCLSDCQAMQQAIRQNDLSSVDAMHIHFALAKMQDDLSEYDEAFLSMQTANQIAARSITYSAVANRGRLDAIQTYFSKPSVVLKVSESELVPVFIIGMPRSGTTLAEQRLATHQQAHAAGELWLIEHMVQELEAPGVHGFPECLDDYSNEDLMAWRLRILQRLSDIGNGCRVVIDKLPLNFQYVGLLLKLFPECRIIHCTRHPMDIGLSTYRQYFPAGVSYSTDLESIGEYYAAYHQLMTFWNQQFPDRILSLNYESMVDQPDYWTRKMYQFTGLADQTIDDTTNSASQIISTASVWQARQPIYATSALKWKRYVRYLEPLKRVLDKYKINAE